ncbi:MAG: hypothetical protein K9K66_00075 [Desulfarculaceae bacterium]|nr:hypothetical protein [Desulfarculaceae bacterium]MCF8072107.1 hypothetical protein [Desulfarculaceae bacterium]MCF8100028.1 hypothetical protein [Desulfarculaceae bacterium]
MASPRILFLVRAYNDIDHMAPIVWRMARDGGAEISLLCANPTYDLTHDFRLNFLAAEHGVRAGYLYQAHAPGPAHRLAASLVCGRSPLGPKLQARLHDKARYRLFGEGWARQMLKRLAPQVLVVDWQRPKFFNLPAMLAAAQDLGIPVLAVPHGMNLVTNTLCTNKAVEEGQDQDFGVDWDLFDHSLVQFELYRKRVIDGGLDPAKVTVMGSARFCPEWREVLGRILPPEARLAGRGRDRLKLVYMDQHHRMRLRPRRIASAMKALARRPGVELMIKPATRGVGQTLADPEWGVSSAEIKGLAELASDTHSLNLIRWADAVLCASSSICLEVLLEGKTLVYPRYFHENHMLFEDFGACWGLDSEKELLAALDQMEKRPATRPYGQRQVDSFLTEAVFGGAPGRDVLGDYARFILERA